MKFNGCRKLKAYITAKGKSGDWLYIKQQCLKRVSVCGRMAKVKRRKSLDKNWWKSRNPGGGKKKNEMDAKEKPLSTINGGKVEKMWEVNVRKR